MQATKFDLKAAKPVTKSYVPIEKVGKDATRNLDCTVLLLCVCAFTNTTGQPRCMPFPHSSNAGPEGAQAVCGLATLLYPASRSTAGLCQH
jgi:hypothetical protein